ncbi:hypothetical protein DICPUDRAFT_157974 [Dictyostelium purpureum]|uniref:Uncharacterized protein n=1 Tax=Dictyostelium purpureum TaxID=5786 RepID=F1A0H9_DICPU|nr:uncharacterized protein DICPUDRAFT_157974 [Dictyostelium purpureum]EGC30293.1 hypothetical protein DICPUDRAFT_157974 [Dictyostelium purpureum]|eukprot:XP_003293172.1 hypothetical protein DICPUDRAFT_157974 [Dictyostelium purpureum]
MEGKRILVTGAGQGIGRAICLELASKGAKVALADINVENCNETIELMKKVSATVETVAIKCDISKTEDVVAMVQTVAEKLGGIDGAVNNAGILGTLARISEYPEETFTKMMDINIKGTWLCIKEVVKQMEKQGKGDYSIVNISSIAGLLGFAYNASYGAVKHAILGITKAAAAEYGVNGIRVNAVLPGSTETSMLRQFLPAEHQPHLEAQTPLRRICQPVEIAKPVCFLLNGTESSYITGQSLVVDGGLSIV